MAKTKAKTKANTKTEKQARTVYRLKIALAGSDPEIWRQVEVPDCTLEELNDVIQIAMGWEFAHLWEFIIDKRRYCPTDEDESPFGFPLPFFGDDKSQTPPPSKVRISDVVKGRGKKFEYVYDMGDSWQHEIRVEGIGTAEPRVKYPRCLAGERACPPEDCGGLWGYQNILHILKHPEDDENDMLEWVGDYDPEEFNAETINRSLSRLRRRSR